MNTWIRKVGMGAVALSLVGALGGCNNGDEGVGGNFLRLYFGINGSGSCDNVTVTVNLSDANAVIARDSNDDVQCELNQDLQDDGCDIQFQEMENGDLRATITDCTIPAVTNLFSCLFEDVDIADLQETASSTCACTASGCDGTPPVCISEHVDPTSCEICDNDIDDDGNGLKDCEDPNCENDPACIGSTTTTSTTSTSSTNETTSTTQTTVTTSSTTTSTTMEQITCRLVFRLADDVTLGSLQWDTDYSDAGELLGQGGNVECASLVEGALAAFNDVDAEQTLDSGLISLDGFTGPINIAECTFKGPTAPTADQFAITVTEASDPNLTPVVPLPDVVIGTIDCEQGPTTTIVTTTTLEPGTTTTTTGGAKNYVVGFTLASASSTVGALQFTVDYATATGEFQGSGASVVCSNKVAGALFAPNDVDANRELTLGLIALSPFSAPSLLVECTFNGNAGDAPTAADFVITIDDATDSEGTPITADVNVLVAPAP